MAEKYQDHRTLYEMIKGMEEPTIKAMAHWVGGILRTVDEGEPLVWNQFTFWCDSMIALDVQPIAPELWPAMARAVAPPPTPEEAAAAAAENPILDAAQQAGIPAEVCAAGRYVVGAILLDMIPPPTMIVVPSYPCDNTKALYQAVAELTGAPLYLVDCPYWMDDEGEAMEYWVKQYKGVISFMEEHSGKKLDYDRLKEVAEESNRYMDCWLEAEELMKLKPLPQRGPFQSGEILTTLGLPLATEAIKARLDVLKAQVAGGATAVPEEKIRVIWNYLPVLWYRELFDWMATELGAVIPTGMTSWYSFEPIDTSTPESTIRGMARRALNGYMGKQGRGASDIWIEDSLNTFEQYKADCIIVNGALGCKWVRGSYGLLRDICRERGIPIMMFDADIADPRIVSADEVRVRIEDFLDTVVGR